MADTEVAEKVALAIHTDPGERADGDRATSRKCSDAPCPSSNITLRMGGT